MNPFHFQLRSPSIFNAITIYCMVALLSGMLLHGQDETDGAPQPEKPQLSETTLKILEAQAQATFDAPTNQVPDESTLTNKKKPKIETGGLIKDWFAPFETDSKSNLEDPSPKPNRKPLWKWFDPTAPMTEAEVQAKPIEWSGKRRTPQRFGNSEKQEPQGWAFFFLRY